MTANYTIGNTVGVAVADDQPSGEENDEGMQECGRCTFCV